VSEEKINDLRTRTKTIRSITSSSETRELCTIVLELLNVTKTPSHELGFAGTREAGDDK
jgi:hypothetical protein